MLQVHRRMQGITIVLLLLQVLISFSNAFSWNLNGGRFTLQSGHRSSFSKTEFCHHVARSSSRTLKQQQCSFKPLLSSSSSDANQSVINAKEQQKQIDKELGLKNGEQINDKEEEESISSAPKLDDVHALREDVTTVLKELRSDPDNTILPPIFSTKLLSITTIWNLEMWKIHTSRKRYFRHLGGIFTSRLLRRILPQLSICIIWSLVCVQILTTRIVAASTHFIPLTSLSLVSTFVAFFLTLRSNQGLDRLSEGRQLWGRTFIVCRDTAQLLAAYAYPKDKVLGLSAARHLALFAWLLKGRLRDTDDTDLIDVMIPSEADRSFMKSQRKKPIATIARIRQVVTNLAHRNVLPIPAHQQLETNLNEMNYICGMCERLRGSPIPPVYTSHTSRLLVFYLLCLPLALNGLQMKKAVTVIVNAIIGYTMLGLDEISHVLEQPFRLMPLHDLSQNIMLDVTDAFVCQPPKLKSDLIPMTDEDEFSYPYTDDNAAPEYW